MATQQLIQLLSKQYTPPITYTEWYQIKTTLPAFQSKFAIDASVVIAYVDSKLISSPHTDTPPGVSSMRSVLILITALLSIFPGTDVRIGISSDTSASDFTRHVTRIMRDIFKLTRNKRHIAVANLTCVNISFSQ